MSDSCCDMSIMRTRVVRFSINGVFQGTRQCFRLKVLNLGTFKRPRGSETGFQRVPDVRCSVSRRGVEERSPSQNSTVSEEERMSKHCKRDGLRRASEMRSIVSVGYVSSVNVRVNEEGAT